MKYTKTEDLGKQIKEEEEKKMVKNFKLQLQERISNKKLPKLARLKEDNNIECILCKFLCKEEISFTKHYATPNHKKALEEFQRNYDKKKKLKEKVVQVETEEIKENDKLDVSVGVKRPAPVSYKIEETYTLLENSDEESNDLKENKVKEEIIGMNIEKKNETKMADNLQDIKEETNNHIIDNLLKKEQNELSISKINNQENINLESNEEIEKNLDRILNEETDEISGEIKNKLKMMKEIQRNKKDEIKIENNNHDNPKQESTNTKNEVGGLKDFFNWKKKKII